MGVTGSPRREVSDGMVKGRREGLEADWDWHHALAGKPWMVSSVSGVLGTSSHRDACFVYFASRSTGSLFCTIFPQIYAKLTPWSSGLQQSHRSATGQRLGFPRLKVPLLPHPHSSCPGVLLGLLRTLGTKRNRCTASVSETKWQLSLWENLLHSVTLTASLGGLCFCCQAFSVLHINMSSFHNWQKEVLYLWDRHCLPLWAWPHHTHRVCLMSTCGCNNTWQALDNNVSCPLVRLSFPKPRGLFGSVLPLGL